MVQQTHAELAKLFSNAGMPLPRNSVGHDLLARRLDCAVISFLHKSRESRGDTSFDSVRAAFVEGEPLYDNAGYSTKNHIQICVRNPACIQGYFRPLDETGKPIQFE